MESASAADVEKADLVEQLAERIGGESRHRLTRLPAAELRYLSWRPDLQARYADGKRGAWLLDWEMSAAERGEQALAQIESCVAANWKPARALDVGCGDGGFLIAMAGRGAVAHGLDLSEGNLRGAQLRGRAWELPITLTLGSAGALPYPDGVFDVVTLGDVLEHVPQPERTLSQIARVLRPGGLLWLSTPTRFAIANLWRDPHYRYFGVAALPRRGAAWYLSRVRRALPAPDDYELERLPTWGGTMATLRRLGFDVICGDYPRLENLRDPSRIRKHWKRRLVSVLLSIGLRRPAGVLLRLAAELTWPLRVVCRKKREAGGNQC